MKGIKTMDDYDFGDKTVLLRVDINSPVSKDGKVEESDRIIEAAMTIKELISYGSKIVVLAHQGRKGKPDFVHLDQHAEILSNYVGKDVDFVDDVIGEKAVNRIKSLGNGEVLLLDNTRLLDEETEDKSPQEHSQGEMVQTLSLLADVFINDAFSAAHRSHASTVGFIPVLPSFMGRLMEREVVSLDRVITRMVGSKHDTFVLSGAKPDEPLNIMSHMLEEGTLENVLVGGVIGEMFLLADGKNLGGPTMKFLEENGYMKYLPQVKELLNKYSVNITMPMDLCVDSGGERKEVKVDELPADSQIVDIGTGTAQRYSIVIRDSENIVMKGPVGIYERDPFAQGTKIIFEAIRNSPGFSLLGGGHTVSAIKKLKVDKNDFDHVSLAGGALITYLSGKTLPVLEALKNSNQ
jgi:phosphoglycerate kinase